LDAFAKIEKGLEQTIVITNDNNEHTLALFEDAVAAMGEKALPWKEKAEVTRKKTKEMATYIRDLKMEIVRLGDGANSLAIVDNRIEADNIEAKDDRESVHNVMLGVNSDGKAYELRKKLTEFRDFLLSNVAEDNPNLKATITGLLDFKPSSRVGIDIRDWETFTFYDTPMISAIALLSKMEVDVLNCESSTLEYLKNQIGKKDIKISDIEAAVSNPNGTIMKGSSSEAEVFLAAYDKNMQATAYVGGRAIPVRNGKAVIPFSGNTIGPNTIAGYIAYKDGEGADKRKNFKIEYMVVEPSLAVSPTKMNVFYLGVDNPVDVSVSGVPQASVKVNISGGASISPAGAGGSYIVKPAQIGKCAISVTATINGEAKNMGSREFRVKRVPSPVPSLYNVTGKNVTRGQLATVQGVVAKMPEDFDFDLKIDVVSFTISVVEGGFVREASSSSNRFTPEQRQIMEKVRSNSRLYITDIRAKAPDGIRELLDISYKVQ
jgi:gliding motility-associated protein GldM